MFVDAILYRYRTGIPWRDLPERYGDWKATHKRLRRWCESGVFARLLEALAFDADAEYMSINSTSVRAHQHSAGAAGQRLDALDERIVARAVVVAHIVHHAAAIGGALAAAEPNKRMLSKGSFLRADPGSRLRAN